MRRRPPLLLLALLVLVMGYPAPARAGCVSSPGAPAACPSAPCDGSREWVCSSAASTPNNKFQYYDGSGWLDLGFSGTGTECSGGAGALKYGRTADHDEEYYDSAGTPVCHK